jgi:hypothetical protein
VFDVVFVKMYEELSSLLMMHEKNTNLL